MYIIINNYVINVFNFNVPGSIWQLFWVRRQCRGSGKQRSVSSQRRSWTEHRNARTNCWLRLHGYNVTDKQPSLNFKCIFAEEFSCENVSSLLIISAYSPPQGPRVQVNYGLTVYDEVMISGILCVRYTTVIYLSLITSYCPYATHNSLFIQLLYPISLHLIPSISRVIHTTCHYTTCH